MTTLPLPAATMQRIRLGAGALRVEVAPQVGGSIARFDIVDAATGAREALLRGCDEDEDDCSDVLAAGCFPLVPFANRICGGRFECEGRSVMLAPNMAGDPSPLHGQGWHAAWQPLGAGAPGCLELVFEHAAGEWPWAYEARQWIELDENGLSLRLVCRNLSAAPMPCGLGFHPYFPCSDTTVLDARVNSVWTVDAQVLPVDEVPADGRYDLRQRRICGQGLDNGYEGWDGSARIAWPERGLALELSSPDAPRFQVYSPAGGGVFVAEPVQNANAALNRPQSDWPAAGLRLLRQGEQAQLNARFEVTRLGGAPLS